MREALAATLDWFAADPEAARFMLVELSAVGPAFRATFQAEYARFTKLLEEGLRGRGPIPELTQATQLAVGAIMARIYEEVVLGRAAELPAPAPRPHLRPARPLRRRRGGAREQEEALKTSSE